MPSDGAAATGDEVILQRLLVPRITTDEAEDLGARLTNAHQLLLAAIKTCVAKGDVASLCAIRTDSLAVHKVLGVIGTDDPALRFDDEPFHRLEGTSVHATRALASLGLALVDDRESAIGHLRVFQQWIDRCGLELTGAPVRVLPEKLKSDHWGAIRHLAAVGELDLLSLVWLGELDSWSSTGRSKLVRTGPSVAVLFDRGDSGQQAVLTLSRVPRLPSGLIPDPAMMALTTGDEAFRSSLGAAWAAAGGACRGAVLWSLNDEAGPVTRVVEESLGLAFTVLLDEQRRLSRRLVGPLTVRRLQPRTAIVGRIDPHNPEAASSVSGYRRKLAVMDESMKVVIPASDLEAATTAERERGGNAELVGVQTWKQAARKARSIHRRRLLALISVVLLVAAGISIGFYFVADAGRDDEQRRAVAADLAARSGTLRAQNPILAAKLALASFRIDGGNERAVDALRNVLSDQRNVVRTWQADPSRLDAIAVHEKLDRVLTSGSDGKTKMWKLSSGEALGELPGITYQMSVAQQQAVVAGVTSDGVSLYDIGGDQLSAVGKVDATCAPDEGIVAFGFVHMDTTLVVVWKNGAISTHDVVTRSQKSCLSPQDALTPLKFPNALPVEKVIAADVVVPDYTDSADEEVILLLSNNNVVSVRTGSRDARIEIPADQMTGDASLVTASKDAISVAVPGGVATWNRAAGVVMNNLQTSLGTRYKVLEESHGHLLVSGESGTSLVQLSSRSWVMAESLKRPSGGAATVAAINERAVVAGGPDGRLWVIADSAGELALPQRTTVTDLAFLPDDRIIAAEVQGSGNGRSLGTNSFALVLLDPKAPPKTDTVSNGVGDPVRWVRGGTSNKFYANAVAVSKAHVAAAGQVNGQAVVQVWSQTAHERWPKDLTLPQPNEASLKPQEKIFAQAEFTPDGRILVARNVTGQVAFWATDDWRLLGELKLKTGNTRMSVRAERAVFLEGLDAEATLVEVEIATRQPIRRVPVPNVVQMSSTPDGSRIATMTEDGSVQLRDRNLDPMGDSWRPSSSGERSYTISLDPSGHRLAIGQGDQVFVYDVDAKTLAMPPIDTEGDTVVDVTWSQDADLLAVGTMPPERGSKQVNPLQVWMVGGMDWTSRVCRWAGDGLSRAEWQTYVRDRADFVEVCAGVGR